MKSYCYRWLAGLICLSLTLAPGRLAQADTWPHRMEHPKGTVIMYQPQLETFQGDKLTGRAAVSVQAQDMKAPVFGVVWIAARVSTDRDTRTVTVEEAKITDAKFPGAQPEQLEKLKAFINQEMKDWDHELSLDRLLAMLEEVEKEKVSDQGLKTEPPRLIFVTHPAVLVLLDGDPKLRPVEKSTLMRVVNTPFLMFYDPGAKAYYLRGDAWLTARDLKGPWKNLETLPEPLKAVEAQVEKAKESAPPAPQVEAKAGKMPEVIISTTPAELLVTAGEPNYTPISGTNLLFVSNTEEEIFLDTGSQQYYVLLSGRWFKGKSLKDGPWSYAAPDALPADFAQIPAASPKGFVRVSVAGTQEAKDAVMDNFIPQTAAIDRQKATTEVKYDGEAKFDKIPGTDLEYATNTGQTVFKEGARYYACDQGVWYEANSPNGPWKVSVAPPKQVNNLPPTNPHYNAKYVQVYDATDDVAYVGYTPGYTGSYVEGDTVVYGTGYSYPPYVSNTEYIPYPATYGYAATYNPYAGCWGYQPPYDPYAWMAAGLVGLGAGIAIGAALGNWGGWWGPGGYNTININNIHNNVIHHDHHRPDGRPIIHPVTKPGEGGRPNLYNRPDNARNLAQKPGVKPASRVTAAKPEHPGAKGTGGAPGPKPGQVSPAKAAPGKAAAKPTQAKAAPSKAAQAKAAPSKAAPAKAATPTAKAAPNNVYAGKNGDVYRQTKEGWQQRQGDQWSKPTASHPAPTAASRPSPPSTRPSPGSFQPPASRPGPDTTALNRDYAARQRGETRTQNFQRSTAPPSRPSGGFGGGRGSGGGGGGGGGGRRR